METSFAVDFNAPLQADGSETEVKPVCSLCGNEVPISEALVPEATDYLIYLCGLDCYARWSAGVVQFLASRDRS